MKYTTPINTTMKDLARAQLGDESRWRELWEVNKTNMRSGTPDLVFAGETIIIPQSKARKPVPPDKKPTPPSLSQAQRPKDSLPSNETRLYVNGQVFTGWTTVNIKRSIEAIAASFSLSYIDKADQSRPDFAIMPGDECVVKIGDQTVVTGYVDDLDPSLDAGMRTLSVTGRDKTSDLVDCAAINRPGEWRGLELLKIAREICNPFGIEVTADVPIPGVIPKFSLQPGETAFEALERLAKMKKVLVTSSTDGKVLFTRTGAWRMGISLEEGNNIMSVSGKYSFKDRFSDYYTEGSSRAKPGVRGSAQDECVKRFRPKIVMAETSTNEAGATDRAAWEAMQSAAKSASATITVQGWHYLENRLWVGNRIVPVKCPSVFIDGDMMITEVEYNKGPDGTTTTLTLKRVDVFSAKAAKVTADKEIFKIAGR